MNIGKILVRVLVSMTFMLALLGANHVDKISNDPLTELLRQIDLVVGDAKCKNDQQCGSIEIGSKPCGGPSGYKVYSSFATDTALLFNLSKQHVQLSREINNRNAIISNCMMEMPPSVKCKNICTIE